MTEHLIKIDGKWYIDLDLYDEKQKELIKENKQLEDLLHKANDEVISYTNCCIDLQDKIDKAIDYIKSDDFWISQRIAEEKLLKILGDKYESN